MADIPTKEAFHRRLIAEREAALDDALAAFDALPASSKARPEFAGLDDDLREVARRLRALDEVDHG